MQNSTMSPPTFKQAITGLTPPQSAEAQIRTVWPAVTGASAPLANLARKMMWTIVLAPIGWLILAPLYFKKILPFLARRYTLTNRRIMIQRGLKPHPIAEAALNEIDEVRLVESSYSPFYKSATLEVVSKGKVLLTLPGVPDPEAFRQSIINAYKAWGQIKTPAQAPAIANTPPAPASS
jgi:hypothetical protein